jgi:SAM-dependent methyltransferase
VTIATNRISRAGQGWPAQEAWSAFWQEPGQSRCVAGAPHIWRELERHWSAFSAVLEAHSRVIDLGCGAGVVARMLRDARHDLHVTGVDFARIPLTLRPGIELLPETSMESLPFPDRSLGAAVSQFAIEYSDVEATARELARVLTPGARLSLLVHHAESAIVITNRRRLEVIDSLLGVNMRAAFCGGSAGAFLSQMAVLRTRFARDELLDHLAGALPSRMARTAPERAAIWKAVEDALAPERCLAESLQSSCVPEAGLGLWLAPLEAAFRLRAPAMLREQGGQPIAWKIEGVRES